MLGVASWPILLKNSLGAPGRKFVAPWKACNLRDSRGWPLSTISALKFSQRTVCRVFRRLSAEFQKSGKVAPTLETSFSTE
jgi:hypothetical protein